MVESERVITGIVGKTQIKHAYPTIQHLEKGMLLAAEELGCWDAAESKLSKSSMTTRAVDVRAGVSQQRVLRRLRVIP